MAIETFEFAFEPRYTRLLRLAGITPDTTLVTVTDDELRVRFGGWKLDTPLAQLAIPTSLHDSLMARLDRLKPVKEVAQTAAVIGRAFDHHTIAARRSSKHSLDVSRRSCVFRRSCR